MHGAENGLAECDGVVESGAVFPVSNYSFEWYSAPNAEGDIISTGVTADELAEGIYTVRVTNLSTGCQAVVSSEVEAELSVPMVTVQSTPNTSCTIQSNGSLTTVVTGSDFSFEWFEGIAAEGAVISSSAAISQKPDGTYTVRVTDVISGCQAIVSAQIQDARTPPVVNVAVTSNSNCSSPNGSLTAVTEGPAVDYEFEWYAGTEVLPEPPIATTQTVTNLPGGQYTVRVADKLTGCISIVTSQVIDECEGSRGFSGVAGDVITNQKKEENASISYYPNPASGTLWLESSTTASLVLINQKGQVVAAQSVYPSEAPFAMDLSGVPAGRYILKVTEAGSTSSYQVIVKK
ncbi:MAG TPA: T9SS type A sorting domain-containing protein [Chryseosolibacter sp.]|nr:T9SS type A sorting domain-containing protein [Chryseosolibacter sp.]